MTGGAPLGSASEVEWIFLGGAVLLTLVAAAVFVYVLTRTSDERR